VSAKQREEPAVAARPVDMERHTRAWVDLNRHDDAVHDRNQAEIGSVGDRPLPGAAAAEPTIDKRLEWARESLTQHAYDVAIGRVDRVLESDPSPGQREQAERIRRRAEAGLRFPERPVYTVEPTWLA
jgi:hypothetical protein